MNEKQIEINRQAVLEDMAAWAKAEREWRAAEAKRIDAEFDAYLEAETRKNCEDNSDDEDWSYCGAKNCESCGGIENE